MTGATRGNGYSATVKLDLEVGDRLISLHQIGPGTIWLREPIDLPPCDAIVVMHIDDHEQRWPVYLPDGLSRESCSGRTFAREPVAPFSSVKSSSR
ncbi:MAG: hypothetical protein ACT4QC_16255 [Planctomycetaceae bacterium]